MASNGKRKRAQTRRKLLVDDHVEVRSEEEGFEGSWHSAVVDACGDGYREVKYEKLIDYDGCSLIFDRVEVSPAVEGLDVEDDYPEYRGFVRPVPPVFKLERYSITYGSCVDVLYKDAWWEGVIFDYEDGAPKRKVFFPDSGDEMDVGITDIRITQDWNEVTDEWKHRGIWYFLEVVEDFKRHSLVVCSLKQLWYNVKGEVGVVKLVDWTSSDRVMWNELVAKAIGNSADDYLVHVIPSIDMSSQSTLDDSPLAELRNCCAIVPLDASLRTKNGGPSEHNNLSSGAAGSDLSVPITRASPEETVLVKLDCVRGTDNLNTKMSTESSKSSYVKTLSTVPDPNLDANPFTAILGLPCADDGMVNDKSNPSGRKAGLWLPLEHNKLPGKKYFPNIIEEYLRPSDSITNPKPDLSTNTRMHLWFCGWRIEQMKDKGGTLRIRYTSPDGKLYHSLRQACRAFREPSLEIVYSAQISHEDLHLSPADAISPIILNETKETEHKKLPGKMLFTSIIEEYLHAFRGNNKPKPPLTTNVKMHLSLCGWSIEKFKDNGGRDRTRYTSPDGKSYPSVRQACLFFKQPTMENVSSTENDQEDTHFSPADAISHTVHNEPKESEDSEYSPMPPLSPNLNVVDVEPEYCLQAVFDYVNIATKKERNTDMRSIRLRAKKHLVATGWKLGYRKGKGNLGMHYLSPTNRSYYALVRACKACIEDRNGDRVASACRPMSSKNVSEEEVPSGDVNKYMLKCLPPPTTSFRGKSRGCCSSQVSREPVGWGNFNSQVHRKSRTKGRKHKSQLARSHSSKSGIKADLPAINRSVTRVVGKNKLRNLDDQSPNFHRSKRRKVVSSHPAHSSRSCKRVRQVAIPFSSLYGTRTELSWLIDNNVVLPREKIYYSGRKGHKPIKEGRITRYGIKCSCCRNLFSLGGFQAHAGCKHQRPCAYIFLKDGRSLLDCQKQVINDIQSRDTMSSGLQQGQNDSICSKCCYGGELILCDQCPSSFHIKCLGLTNVPDAEWFCPSCCCGICGHITHGENENVTDDTIVNCVQCEHKYHFECLQRVGGFMLSECPMKGRFCGKRCKEVFLGIHKLLGRKISVGADNLTWTLLKSMTSESLDSHANVEVLTDNYIKLKDSLGVMHECFESVKDPYTKSDIAENVVFSRGSDLNRLNFRGFYTALLERNDEVVTVATVRVYGEKVAEVPLIGTRFQYRRLGMCRIMMNELEKKLKSIGVERLVLPAVPSMLNAWTTSFGFSQMTDSERLQYSSYTLLAFQGTIMCHKILLENPYADPFLLRESEPKCNINVNGNGDDVIAESDGSSSISEVFQAEQLEDNATLDQRLLNIPGSGNCDNSGTVHQLVVAKEAVMKIQLKNSCLKYYVRRKRRLIDV